MDMETAFGDDEIEGTIGKQVVMDNRRDCAQHGEGDQERGKGAHGHASTEVKLNMIVAKAHRVIVLPGWAPARDVWLTPAEIHVASPSNKGCRTPSSEGCECRWLG